MRLRYAARTDVGRIREANEDAFLVKEPLFVVADGMGGHTAGDVASSLAVDTISDHAAEASPDDVASLAQLVRRANSRIWEHAQQDSTLRGMGTTCTLVLIAGEQAHIAHVGDSRAYLLRSGRLTQLTEDHTLVGQMVRQGRLTEQEAEHHPQRSIITRALGVEPEVDVDLLSTDLAPGDRLLLCSDGLSSMVDAGTIAAILSEERDPEWAADRLVEAANAAGGEDNITVVVIDVADGPVGASAAPGEATPVDATSPSPPVGAGGPGTAAPTARPRGAGTATAVREEREASRARGASGPPPPAERPRNKLRRALTALAVAAVLVAGGVLGARWLLERSFFVGVNAQGYVTIYRGIPEEVAGLSLREEVRVTDLALSELPEFLRDNVRDGIKEDSLAEARARVAALRGYVRPERPERREGRRRP